ncbi:MAG: VWA domain-containing protein [Oscillospiraceae bacterium]
MPYKTDDGFNTIHEPARGEMDELDLSKAREKKVDNSKTLRNGRYDGLRSFDELPPLKIDMMKDEKKRDVTADNIKPEQSYAKHKRAVYRTEEEKKQRLRGIIIGVVAVIAVYIFAGVYANSLNKDYIIETSGELASVGVSSMGLTKENYDKKVSDYDKESHGLSLYLADSDGDGLSDAYEISKNISDPNNPDSDGDGLTDGVEILAGLGPKNKSTDGKTPDKSVQFTRTETVGIATAEMNGNANVYGTQVAEYSSALANYPGVIGELCELYSVKSSSTVRLSFAFDDEALSRWGSSASNLRIYKVDPSTSKFEEVGGTKTEGGTVSADITKDGVYVLGDKEMIESEKSVRVFFLIDNSGSMYPLEQCEGSEENDVDFRRVDLAVSIMDGLYDVSFGAGKFTGNYTRLIEINDNASKTEKRINSIVTGKETFDGTNIAYALRKAAEEFDDNKLCRDYIVLLTDGNTTTPNTAAERTAVDYCNEKNITVITIGLGKQITESYLLDIANQTNGMFFHVSNAEGLEPVADKICSIISENRISENDEKTGDMFVISDTGYNYEEDGLRFGIPTTENIEGSALGTAMINKLYYSGRLNLKEDGYKSVKGGSIEGYDISDHAFFGDTKQNLCDLALDCAKDYRSYLIMQDKWDFKHIVDGTLYYTDETKNFLQSKGMETGIKKYSGEATEDDGLLKVIKIITFQKLASFENYETAIVDISKISSEDKKIVAAIKYYDNLHLSSKAEILSFGANGDKAFEALESELASGSPSVVTTGDHVYNVARLLRKTSDPNTYIIEAHDVSEGETVKIVLSKQPIYDDAAGTKFQYVAKISDKDVPLYIYR